jgi:hypothetical protein
VSRLSTNENQNAGCERQNSGYDHRDSKVNEGHDSNKNQVNREQEHSNVFGDHGPLLEGMARHLHALNCIAGKCPTSECRSTAIRLRFNASLARRSLGEGGNALTNQLGEAVCVCY